MSQTLIKKFGEFLTPNKRPYTLGPTEDAKLVGMKLYGEGPFFREYKEAIKIRKKSHFVIKEGDVIYNKLFAWKGTFGIVPPALDSMFVSDKFPTYELNKDLVLPEYLRWYFRWDRLWDMARRMSTGSAALSKLTLNPPKFLELTMPIPSKELQRDLAQFFDQIQQNINQIQVERAHASDHLNAFMPSCIEEVFGKDAKFVELGDVLKGKPRNGWSARCDNAEGGTPVLSLGAVTGFHFRGDQFKLTSLPTEEGAHYWLREGDLLMTRSNTPELVGHAAIYTGEPTPCIYPDLMMRLEVDENKTSKKFLWWWLQSRLVRKIIKEKAKGTSPTMKKISQPIVMALPFPKLSSERQLEIVSKLEEISEATRIIESEHQTVEADIKKIIPHLLDSIFERLTESKEVDIQSISHHLSLSTAQA